MEENIFSERERAKQKAFPYQHDEIPERLRIHIQYVLRDVIRILTRGTQIWKMIEGEWGNIWNVYCQIKGVPPEKNNPEVAESECWKIVRGNDRDATFDIIEIMFRYALIRRAPINQLKAKTDQLNNYFRKEAFGWELKNNQMLKIDSPHISEEIIEPVLDFLRNREFESANKQFLSAHEHYRNGRYGDCVTNASSAFETVIKIICDDKNWNYGRKAGKDLVLFLLDKNEFIPKYLRKHFEELIPTLWTGLFPTRNNHPPGHGQGEKATEVYAYMAGYALNLAATNILLLVQIHESQKSNNAQQTSKIHQAD